MIHEKLELHFGVRQHCQSAAMLHSELSTLTLHKDNMLMMSCYNVYTIFSILD